ncbi:MAG: hypothetical protein H0U06_10545 [Solirubrobacterales bacterium]|nr:hypothetical protein [Solirubrobacterales bacterium]
MTGRAAAWIGLAAGVPILGLVVALFQRVMRPAGEIDRYAKDILASGLAISGNLEGATQLDHTRDLGAAVPGLALAYLERLGAGG